MTEVATGGRLRPVQWVSPGRVLPLDRAALSDVTPVLVGIAPFALLIGVRIAETPVNGPAGLSGSLLLFAGSAHLSALGLLAQGASMLSVLLTVTLVNARFLVYGAVLAPRFADQPAWFRWCAPQFIVDQTFGLATAREDLHDTARFRHYWLTIGGAIALVWVSAMATGLALGPSVPSSPAMSFLPTAVFVGLLVPALTGRPAVAAAVTAGLVVAVLPAAGGTRVLVAIVTGAVAGRLVTRRSA
jgi:predicted branched-subunit amino acid permease